MARAKPGCDPADPSTEGNPLCLAITQGRYLKGIRTQEAADNFRAGLLNAGFPEETVEKAVRNWRKRFRKDGEQIAGFYGENYSGRMAAKPPVDTYLGPLRDP